jgi:uncharacterized protein with GYD domain
LKLQSVRAHESCARAVRHAGNAPAYLLSGAVCAFSERGEETKNANIYFGTDLDRPGVRTLKDVPKRGQIGRELAKRFGGEVKQIFFTSGDSDILAVVEAPNGDDVVKMALAIAGQGNARTHMKRAWTEAEMAKIIAELP